MCIYTGRCSAMRHCHLLALSMPIGIDIMACAQGSTLTVAYCSATVTTDNACQWQVGQVRNLGGKYPKKF